MSPIDVTARVLGEFPGLTPCHDPPAEPAAAGRFAPPPAGLHPLLAGWLRERYPAGLYTHQAAAVEQLLAHRHTVVTTRTASGKSLLYALPVFDALLRDPAATALFLFPQKALANDQLRRLREDAAQLPPLAARLAAAPHLIARYDGSTPADDKPAVRSQGQLLLTNPDMLHKAVTAWHDRHWQRLLANLRYVVVDECHEYRGMFGTNVAHLLRRLRALAWRYGADPTVVATSATAHDPPAHLHRLTGLRFEPVGADHDGSRQGQRKFWMVKSAEHHYEAGRKLTLALKDAGLTVLTFCLSRTAAERMAERANRDDDPSDVRVYRAGLKPADRQAIERGLHDRTVRAVFATSALELGIDIGAVDVVVCVGLPPTSMSLWQRAGRAGRAGKDGAVVLIPADTPLDAYHAAHPDRLFARPHEPLVLSLHNPKVLYAHYACAVKEASGGEAGLDLPALGAEVAGVKAARDAGTPNELLEDLLVSDDPHHRVNVRGGGDDSYTLECDGEAVGEIDQFHLLREAPRNGIYRHGGVPYRVRDVNRAAKKVLLKREYSRNSTSHAVIAKVTVKRVLAGRRHGRVLVAQARLDVKDLLVDVTEKGPDGAVVSRWPGTGGMPTHTLPTTGTLLRVDPAHWQAACAALGDKPAAAALEAVRRLFASLFPTVTGPCDPSDFAAATDVTDKGATVYLYDAVPFGVDLAVGAFDRVAALADRAAEVVRDCDCADDAGCFKCVKNPRADDPTSRRVTAELLRLLRAELAVPPAVVPADAPPPPAARACPKCGTPAGGKFCGECGEKLGGAA